MKEEKNAQTLSDLGALESWTPKMDPQRGPREGFDALQEDSSVHL